MDVVKEPVRLDGYNQKKEILNGQKPGRGQHSKQGCKALIKCGLYMLATILKDKQLVKKALAARQLAGGAFSA